MARAFPFDGSRNASGDAHADDEVEAARGEEAHRRLAIFAANRLEEARLDAELLLRALEPRVRCVVEAFVAASAHVEDEPDARRGLRGRSGGVVRLARR